MTFLCVASSTSNAGTTCPAARASILSWPLVSLSTRSAKKRDRKSTRLNSSHGYTSYAVFCLKKNSPENHRSHANIIPEELATPMIDRFAAQPSDVLITSTTYASGGPGVGRGKPLGTALIDAA